MGETKVRRISAGEAKGRRNLTMPPRASRHRIDLNDLDFALLEEAAASFGLSKSETVRRLLRAALNIGPALSEENSQVVAGMAGQLRRVGLNLMQMLKAIHGGRAVQIEDSVEVWQVLHERISAMDKELSRMTEAYGVKLRRDVMVEQKTADQRAPKVVLP